MMAIGGNMKTQLISDSLKAALEQQIANERYNATIYLYVAGYFRANGCDNIGKIFIEQHAEEISHSLMIFDLLTDLNIFPDIPEVAGCQMAFDNPMFVADLYLEREIDTTKSLGELRDMAGDEDNVVVEERMREMIKIQQTEYEEATSFNDKINALQDFAHIILWDASLEE